MGYSFINLGADVVAFGNYCRDIQNKLRAAGLK